MSNLCKREEEVSLISPAMNIKSRKTLKGHRGRILHFDWSPDKSHLMTAGQVSLQVKLCPGHEAFLLLTGWICAHLEWLYGAEGDYDSDDISVGLGLFLCTVYYNGGLWVRRGVRQRERFF